MNILLLSAYDTLSHNYWSESLVAQFPEHQWTVLTLPPRHFNFRVRSNPLSWLGQHALELDRPYALVVATSLVDIATLRGLVPALASTPLWVYCHENQFAYPSSGELDARAALQHELDAKMVFVYSLLAADAISFNSHWNMSSALAGIEDLFRAFPEKLDDSLLTALRDRSGVLPVPLAKLEKPAAPKGGLQREEGIPQLLWNHRWEYDKGPDYLLAFARLLQEERLPAKLHIVGRQFRRQPEAFSQIARLLESADSVVELGQYGYIESREAYFELLEQCDIVLSTALHDFQGLSVLEAVQRGCLPLLPDRLAYPEMFGEQWLYGWKDKPVESARSMLEGLKRLLVAKQLTPPSVAALEWSVLRDRYAQKLQTLTRNR